ncbi:hypothetical protein [Tritonibacter mobilis]|uniref:hypothetical protein n=1 Tax=Tritonibacter mobilis TaxID=379347 RepID=UPI001401DBE1|nr:hypothetical protein [Tritonibacter mobilis]NHM17877.1 hypothetical protein [Tritonibacter mobilis]NHM22989.1 hypothetical protein [Tritonibacter mobilis]
MSEPVTHAEIEDVLSSIRRLVSETGRAEEPARPAAKPATRLVLTPALRVPEAEVARSDAAKHDAVQHGRAAHSDAVTPRDAAFDAAPEHPQEPVMPQVNGTARNGTASDKLTTQTDAADPHGEPRDEAATSGPLNPQGEVPEEAAPERADDAGAETSAQEPSRVLFRASAPVDAPRKPELVRTAPSEAAMVDSFQQNEPVAEAPFVNVDDAEAQTFEESERSAPILLNTKSAPRFPETERPEAPAAVADRALNEVAADDTAADGAAGDDAPWRDPEARLYDSLEPGVAQAEQPTSAEPQNMQREQSSRVAAVVRRIAELETAGRAEPEAADQSSRRVPDINEDEIEAVPHSGPTVETIQWEDHQEEASGGASFASARDSVAENAREMAGDALTEAAMDRLAAHEDFLDEEGLRELVSDIVREELQGALGERITRNVRKLVRREIQRALATQELL